MNEQLFTETQELYHRLTGLLIRKNITVSTMESCTSGTVASLLTDLEGASAVFSGAAVTYCNEQKVRFGVSEEVLRTYSVYSVKTAESMAKAAADWFGTKLGIGVTGCFGNTDPANPEGVPGKVYYSCFMNGNHRSGTMCIPSEYTRTESKLFVAKMIASETHEFLREVLT